MNNKVVVRYCSEYVLREVIPVLSEIYEKAGGPEVSGKRVLLKPNILADRDPMDSVTTHPVIVEGMIHYLQSKGADLLVGDSPAFHTPRFKPYRSGITKVCEATGAQWVDFLKRPDEIGFKEGKIKTASAIKNVDVVISLPKLKNHELVYFTGAIKNTLGLVPGFVKVRQHALHQSRNTFAEFLVDLTESVTPDFFLIDGIMAMEGPGPGQGWPVKLGLLIGSTNPLAADIIAGRIVGYAPEIIPTSRIALHRKRWLLNEDEIGYDGPPLDEIVKKDFVRIPLSGNHNIALQFLIKRVKFLRKLERRPQFIHKRCTGCQRCVNICPVKAIEPHPDDRTKILLTDSKCIRCYCCSEICNDNAIKIKRKPFGV